MKSLVSTINPNRVLSIFDPWEDVFGDFFGKSNFTPSKFLTNTNLFGTMPATDVKEDKEKYLLEMELPGMTDKDVEVKVTDNMLSISSAKKEETEKHEEDGYIVRERRSSSFSRSFNIPRDVNTENIMASFKDGLLIIKMPKAEESKEKSITITKE